MLLEADQRNLHYLPKTSTHTVHAAKSCDCLKNAFVSESLMRVFNAFNKAKNISG